MQSSASEMGNQWTFVLVVFMCKPAPVVLHLDGGLHTHTPQRQSDARCIDRTNPLCANQMRQGARAVVTGRRGRMISPRERGPRRPGPPRRPPDHPCQHHGLRQGHLVLNETSARY